jgi:NADP-dependent 3-hydroxy acid dehydrogenase YdfG
MQVNKVWTVQEVQELQNQKAQYTSRLDVHKQRAAEKQKELDIIYANFGVQSYEQLQKLAAEQNAEMQKYATEEEQVIKAMKDHCEELDRLL